jgi:hypothetical protein
VSSEEEALKLQAFGKIQGGAKLSELVLELGVPYPKLLKWRKELKEAEANGTVASLVDVDVLLLHEVAEAIKHDIQELTQDEIEREAIEGEVISAVKGIEGYQVLNEKVQATALRLTKRIDSLSMSVSDAKDVCALVDALTKIQVAFFNKSGTYVQINNSSQNDSALGEFKGLMGD